MSDDTTLDGGLIPTPAAQPQEPDSQDVGDDAAAGMDGELAGPDLLEATKTKPIAGTIGGTGPKPGPG
ncbi:MAG: hypothetical protein RBU45_04550 [Myxococcota bacterium]|jgi:hypothetical protein|nr:hypothetical protein [Myxococcota bacterium]